MRANEDPCSRRYVTMARVSTPISVCQALLDQHTHHGPITGDSRHSFPCTPLTQTLHSCPMTIFLCHICNYHAHRLEIGRFEISQKAVVVSGGRRHTVITNQWLREYQDLTAIRGVCQ